MADLCSIKDWIFNCINEVPKVVTRSLCCQRRKSHFSDQDIAIRFWSELPNDLLDEIIRYIESPTDYLNIIAVCRTWRISSHDMKTRLRCNLPFFYPLHKKHPLPMLLQRDGKEMDLLILYSIANRKVCKINVPDISNKWIVGSWKGWLMTINQENKIHLLNPITKVQVPLPPLSTFPMIDHSTIRNFEDIHKIVILSSEEAAEQCNITIIALATPRRLLYSCKIGDNRWQNMYPLVLNIDDVIEFKGHLYAVDYWGTLYRIEVGLVSKVTLIAVLLRPLAAMYYLAESFGQLLLVAKRYAFKPDRTKGCRQSLKTVGFIVYKLTDSQNYHHVPNPFYFNRNWHSQLGLVQKIWIETESLHDQGVFIGNNRTMCLDPNLYPDCKGNCIYFADYYERIVYYYKELGKCLVPHDSGVFSMNDKKIDYFTDGTSDLLPVPTIWFSPNPW